VCGSRESGGVLADAEEAQDAEELSAEGHVLTDVDALGWVRRSRRRWVGLWDKRDEDRRAPTYTSTVSLSSASNKPSLYRTVAVPHGAHGGTLHAPKAQKAWVRAPGPYFCVGTSLGKPAPTAALRG
jgi:hypothetical protein